jgi:Undecaprenyl-phosphate galactose phosphotransferase WbaP
LSTQYANDPTDNRPALPSARPAPLKPHLVSTVEVRTELESVAELTDSSAVFDLSDGVDYADAPGSTTIAQWPAAQTRSLGAFIKRALDICGAVLLALVFFPLMVVILVLTWGQDGSVIYEHRRVGRGGRMFGCLKFRTMVADADQALGVLLEHDAQLRAEWARDHKLRNDPRVTRLGRFLRRTSLDELPQIWNVLRGEMSLVGPRPVVREELLRYGRNAEIYLAARPGITGLWQVTGRNNTDYRRRVALDTYYVRNQSFWLDLYILLRTTRVVLGRDGAY